MQASEAEPGSPAAHAVGLDSDGDNAEGHDVDSHLIKAHGAQRAVKALIFALTRTYETVTGSYLLAPGLHGAQSHAQCSIRLH